MSDLERTYTPAEAAKEYSFASSLLRRYAAIYESLGGTVTQDKRGGRIYTAELLRHFSSARERVKDGEKVEDALKTLELAPAQSVQNSYNDVVAQQLLELLERVLNTNEGLRQEMTALRDQVDELAQRQLETPKILEDDTARMNRYLLGELERRRVEAEAQGQRRPWWQLWGRK